MQRKINATGNNIIYQAGVKGMDLNAVVTDEGDNDDNCETPDADTLPLRFACLKRYRNKKKENPSLLKSAFVRTEKQIIKNWIYEDKGGLRTKILEPGKNKKKYFSS